MQNEPLRTIFLPRISRRFDYPNPALFVNIPTAFNREVPQKPETNRAAGKCNREAHGSHHPSPPTTLQEYNRKKSQKAANNDGELSQNHFSVIRNHQMKIGSGGVHMGHLERKLDSPIEREDCPKNSQCAGEDTYDLPDTVWLDNW
jgi:hypothetical protein